MKWTLRVGWTMTLVLSVPVTLHAAEPPKKDALPAVVELFEDDADSLLPQLTNAGGSDQGTAKREDADKFAGVCSLRVTPLQRFTPSVNGWAYPIVEKPAAGQYRYVRF